MFHQSGKSKTIYDRALPVLVRSSVPCISFNAEKLKYNEEDTD